MKVKKVLLMFIFTLISLFSFCLNVYADGCTNSALIFEADFGKKNSAIENLCNKTIVDSTTKGMGGCTFISNDGTVLGNGYFELYDSDKNKIAKFCVQNPTNASSLKDELYKLNSCGENSDSNCWEWIGGQYCSFWTDDSKSVCKELEKVKSASIKDETRGTEKCTVPLNSYTYGKTYDDTVKSFSLEFVYNVNNDDFEFKMDGSAFGTGKKSYKKNGNTFNLYPYGGEDKFEDVMEELKQKYKNSDYKCDSSIGTFCMSKDSRINDVQWYFELNGCDSDKYRDDISQDIGGTFDFTERVEDANLVNEIVFVPNEFTLCSDGNLFGDKYFSDLFKLFVNAIKILIPLLLIILGSLDFVQAIFAQDESAIKKAQSKFIRRLIIAVIIFIVPIVLKMLLGITSDIWPNIISPDESGSFFCGFI